MLNYNVQKKYIGNSFLRIRFDRNKPFDFDIVSFGTYECFLIFSNILKYLKLKKYLVIVKITELLILLSQQQLQLSIIKDKQGKG